MTKCILKGLSQSDPYSGEMIPFETLYNGIPEACYMWASGYKHLIQPLSDAIEIIECDPNRFKKFNPTNRWGPTKDLLNLLGNI